MIHHITQKKVKYINKKYFCLGFGNRTV